MLAKSRITLTGAPALCVYSHLHVSDVMDAHGCHVFRRPGAGSKASISRTDLPEPLQHRTPPQSRTATSDAVKVYSEASWARIYIGRSLRLSWESAKQVPKMC